MPRASACGGVVVFIKDFGVEKWRCYATKLGDLIGSYWIPWVSEFFTSKARYVDALETGMRPGVLNHHIWGLRNKLTGEVVKTSVHVLLPRAVESRGLNVSMCNELMIYWYTIQEGICPSSDPVVFLFVAFVFYAPAGNKWHVLCTKKQ